MVDLEGVSSKEKFFSTTCLICSHERLIPVTKPKKESASVTSTPDNLENTDNALQ